MTHPNTVSSAAHPLNDEFVLRGRPLRPGIVLEDSACFHEDRWPLRPALLQQQQPSLVLTFQDTSLLAIAWSPRNCAT
jgi:hypothetical protein